MTLRMDKTTGKEQTVTAEGRNYRETRTFCRTMELLCIFIFSCVGIISLYIKNAGIFQMQKSEMLDLQVCMSISIELNTKKGKF